MQYLKIYLNFGTIILSKHKKKTVLLHIIFMPFHATKILEKHYFERKKTVWNRFMASFAPSKHLTQISKGVYHSYLWIATLSNEQCSICRQKVVSLMYSSFCIDLIILWIRHFHCVSSINHKSRLHYHKSQLNKNAATVRNKAYFSLLPKYALFQTVLRLSLIIHVVL